MWRLKLLLVGILLIGLPAAAGAGASVGGVVKDSSGAVLPGVTVEASSPALIEKVRTVVTDGSGQYKIEQLRPGTYAVTFTLTGFSTVKREGLELNGSFAATVNAELRVGAVEETIDGERAVAACGRPERGQTTRDFERGAHRHSDRAHVIHGRHPDSRHEPQQPGRGRHQHHQHHGGSITAHGSSGNDQRVMIDPLDGQRRARRERQQLPAQFRQRPGGGGGLLVGHRRTGVWRRAHQHDSAPGREHDQRIVFHGGEFVVPGQQLHAGLSIGGLKTPNSINVESDINPGLGGPIRKDTLWFYLSARWCTRRILSAGSSTT